MTKDFDGWNAYKKRLHTITPPLFKERDVWWCSLGMNIGDEQDGKNHNFTRPVLVLRKFNRNISMCIPLSTQIKNSPFYHQFHFKGKEQSLLLSQTRLLDARRFKDKMGSIREEEITLIKEKLRLLVL